MGIEVVHWNPRIRLIPTRLGLKVPLYRGYRNNFGDLLGPMIVDKLIQEYGLKEPEHANHRLLTVGSILQFANNGDTVWGSGALGEIAHRIGDVHTLDVRAVRGPLSRDLLINLGHQVPEIYGDPALLLGHLWRREDFLFADDRTDYAVVPNHAEMKHFRVHKNRVINPTDNLMSVLRRIASSDFVASSSLHGIIVAEAFGIPARLIVTPQTKLFKYKDYYNGTGRELPEQATSVEHALRLGGADLPAWHPLPLLEAFPKDLWTVCVKEPARQ